MVRKTLYFGNPTYLSSNNKQLVIKILKTGEERTVPFEDIAVLVLDNQQITISHKVIQDCIEYNISLISCNYSHMPSGMIYSLDQNSTQTKRYKEQISISEPLRKNLWKQTIEAKVENQARLLKYFDKDDKKLRVLKNEILSGDSTNVEGHVSNLYWKILFGKGFIRNQSGDIPNAHLNYGYSIIRGVVARSIASSGLNLSFGIFHKNKYNPFCLADDIMEPLRPFCDMLVFQMFNNGEIHDNDITKEQKTILLKLPAVDVIMDDMLFPLMESLNRTTNSLYECMIGKNKKINYPKFYINE